MWNTCLKRFEYIKRTKKRRSICLKNWTPKQKELLNLYNDLSDTILTDKPLESKSQEDENENDNEDENENVNENENNKTLMSWNDENKKQNKLLTNDNNANAKNEKTNANTKKDENKDMLLEYMGDVDDKLFKEYSDGKYFNSFINEINRATNEEDKEKVVE